MGFPPYKKICLSEKADKQTIAARKNHGGETAYLLFKTEGGAVSGTTRGTAFAVPGCGAWTRL